MNWDIRDPADMDELRADLMGCPADLHGEVVAAFVGDPGVALGAALRRRLAGMTAGRLFDPADAALAWRRVVENVLPVDGRDPDPAALERFMAAATAAGWSDPRLEAGFGPGL